MRTQVIRFASALLLCATLPAHAGLFDDDEARKRIDQLRADVDERTQRLEEAARGQALLVNQLEALRSELARMRGQVEVNTNNIDQGQKRQKDLYTDLDNRLRKIETSLAELLQKVSVAMAPKPEPAVDPAQETRDYEAAVNFLRSGRHVDAAQSFRQFIKNWPKSGFVAGAHYWAGTALMQARDFNAARDFFDAMAQNWPDDPLAPDALLGLANSEQELGDSRASRKTLETLVDKYPRSDAAKTARQRLNRR